MLQKVEDFSTPQAWRGLLRRRRPRRKKRLPIGDFNEGFHRLVDSFIQSFEEPYADLICRQKMKKVPEEQKSHS